MMKEKAQVSAQVNAETGDIKHIIRISARSDGFKTMLVEDPQSGRARALQEYSDYMKRKENEQ